MQPFLYTCVVIIAPFELPFNVSKAVALSNDGEFVPTQTCENEAPFIKWSIYL